MPLDLADDIEIFDWVQAVEFQHRTLAGVVTATDAAVKALRRATAFAPDGAGSGTQAMTVLAPWHLKAADLSVPPKKGDRFVAAGGETWELADASLETLGTRWAATCRRVG